jgi:hypothetical protein
MIAALNNQQEPTPTVQTAKLRDELNLMLRASDDSADYETADTIGRAVRRAEQLLKSIERSLDEQETPLAA